MSTKQTPDEAHVQHLIERAAERAGSMNKLAKVLGVAESVPRGWKALSRPIGAEDRARLAAIAGDDAVQELVRAVLAKTEGTTRGDQLRAILGNALRPIGGAAASVLLALGSLTYSPTAEAARAMISSLDTMCRKVKWRPRWA